MSAKWNNSKPGTKTWVHSAAALTAGHVVYNIKYLGHVEVSAPKGADIVKEAVTKLKFNKQVKRSEGTKPPKRELTISVDGVTVQDRNTKEKQFAYPLHHISYCADDKSDKKVCAFIAKDVTENKHLCHVMESDKNAEEITLTVGQAFDLAYQKFLANANKSQEQQQQNETLRKRVSSSPGRSPQMGRVYSYASFVPGESFDGRGSPSLGPGTPPGRRTPTRVATPPALSPSPPPPPPPPAAIPSTSALPIMLHPAPPSPPPPPPPLPPHWSEEAPMEAASHPTPDPTDESHTYLSPIPRVESAPSEVDPHGVPDVAPGSEGPPPYEAPPVYSSREILQTRL